MKRDPVLVASAVLVGLVVVTAFALARVDPAWVERVYARGVYPVVGQGIGKVTGLVGFSVTEPGAVLVAVLGIGVLVRGGRRLRTWVGLVGAAAFAWLAFQAVWGINYRREPIARAFVLEVRPSSPAELRDLAMELLVLTEAVRPEPGPDAVGHALGEAPDVYRRSSRRFGFLGGEYARPKPLIGSAVLSWLGLLGFYDPYTAEPNINVEPPAFVIPFVVLHEMAHQRGVASEDEANFVGYLLGREDPDPAFAYSAAWEGFTYAVSALTAVDPDGAREIWDAQSAPVRGDSDAYRAWRAAHKSPLEQIARAINDTYLRTQGVHDGVQSYGRVVDLMLAERRARMPAGATP